MKSDGRSLLITMGALVACVAVLTPAVPGALGQEQARSFTVSVPLGLDLAAPVPADNPLTVARVELGRRLFFDPTLSADGTMTCASCHRPEDYFTNDLPRSIGVHGRPGRRSVPSILNAAYGDFFFWDGRATTLEEQVLRPIEDPRELDLELAELVNRLQQRAGYRTRFAEAFPGGEISEENIGRALASYVRTLRSGDAPIDRFLDGDRDALSADARAGYRLFTGTADCDVCHPAPLFTNRRFRNTGVSWGSGDLGRHVVTRRDEDRGAFKVPSLRNVAATAPYMHDGSISTLEEVIDHYDRGGVPNPNLDPNVRPLGLTAVKKRQLIAFLEALTGSVPSDP